MQLVAEVTFDVGFGGGSPWDINWNAGEGAGVFNFGNIGKDAWSLYMDRDGETCWAFEYFGAGFARFNLSDGSPVFTGRLFGYANTNLSGPFEPDIFCFDNYEDASVSWAQDDQGHYYTFAGQNFNPNTGIYAFSPPFDPTPTKLIKLGLGPGAIGQGYLELLDYIDFSAPPMGTPGPGGSLDGYTEGGMIWARSGGVGYLACNLGFASPFIFNSDTMSLVGYAGNPFSGPSGAYQGTFGSCFVDKFGDFWWLQSFLPGWNATLTGQNGVNLLQWKPSNGASTNVLNMITQYIPSDILGFGLYPPFFSAYVPSIHAVFLAGASIDLFGSPVSTGIGFPGPGVLIDLTTFERIAFHPDDRAFFLSGGDLDGAEAAMHHDVQTGEGMLVIPAPYPYSAFGNGARPDGGYAGFMNVVNPSTLRVQSAYDITGILNSSGVANKPVGPNSVSGGPNNEFASIAYNCRGKLAVTYAFIGSPVYIFDMFQPQPHVWIST